MFTVVKPPHRVKARKIHYCDYCNNTICIGEEHEVATYSDDTIYDWRCCDRCKPYVNEAFYNDDYDWEDGMGNQDFHDYMWSEHYDIAKQWWGGMNND